MSTNCINRTKENGVAAVIGKALQSTPSIVHQHGGGGGQRLASDAVVAEQVNLLLGFIVITVIVGDI
jgi:hypothetical protein